MTAGAVLQFGGAAAIVVGAVTMASGDAGRRSLLMILVGAVLLWLGRQTRPGKDSR